MNNTVRLVPAPSIEEEIRDSAVALLREALLDAESGNVSGVIIITKEKDGMWGHRVTPSLSVREEIGAIEAYKWDRFARLEREE